MLCTNYAAKLFYDFGSCKKIGKLFGREYGMRRFGPAIMARLGTFGATLASKIPVPSVYYRLSHMDEGKEPGERLLYPEKYSFPAGLRS